MVVDIDKLEELKSSLRGAFIFAYTSKKLCEAGIYAKDDLDALFFFDCQEIESIVNEIAAIFEEVKPDESSLLCWVMEDTELETTRILRTVWNEVVDEIDRKWKSVT